MKYFGTDGLREMFSQKLVDYCYKIGYALATSYNSILVACDTRDTSPILTQAFITGARKMGAYVSYIGIAPTPTLAFGVRNGFFKAGAMITASHNPPMYNGIKLFDGLGYKLCEKELVKIENQLENIEVTPLLPLPKVDETPIQDYISHLKKHLSKLFGNNSILAYASTNFSKSSLASDFNKPDNCANEHDKTENFANLLAKKSVGDKNVKDLVNYSDFEQSLNTTNLNQSIDFPPTGNSKNCNQQQILIDCANGATISTAPLLFDKNNSTFWGTSGTINTNCGVFCLDKLVKIKKENNLDLAFCFDGDGDRILALDEDNQILNGDAILFILARWLKENNKLKDNTVVGTTYTSLGTEKSLNNLGIILVRTNVGDRHVAEIMQRNEWMLGGESSGHIIFNSSTGDGVKTALLLERLAKEIPLKERKQGLIITPQMQINYKKSQVLIDKLQSLASKYQPPKGKGRILVRESGTEPIIRVLFEHIDKIELDKIVEKFEKDVQKE